MNAIDKNDKNENLLHQYENLKLKYNFLLNRLEELRDENFRLHSKIASLSDEIQLEKITIAKLNEINTHLMKEINEVKFDYQNHEKSNANLFLRKLTTYNLVLSTNQKLNVQRKTSTNFNTLDVPENKPKNFMVSSLSPLEIKQKKSGFDEVFNNAILEGDRDPLENYETSKKSIDSKGEIEIPAIKNIENQWIEQIKTFFQNKGIDNEQKLKEILDNYLEDTEKFYSLNHLINYELENPIQKTEIKKSEKYFENIEEVIKEWNTKLKDLQKNSAAFVNSLQNFLSNSDNNLGIFKENNEIYFILYVFNDFLKVWGADIESTVSNIKESFENLLNDAKSEIQNIKDLKKKYCISMEDFEKFQMKIINLKKTQIHKNPANYQVLSKSYLEKMKNYEINKNEYINNLNQINFKFNLALNDKLCFLFLYFGNIYGNGCSRIDFLEEFIKNYTENLTKKGAIFDYLQESFLNFRTTLDDTVKTYNLFANHKLIEKSGYLFKKAKKTKEFKKKYFRINEGVLISEYQEKSSLQTKKKIISPLNLINLKEDVELDFPYSFEITCPQKPKPITLLVDCQRNQIEWCSTIKNNIESMLSNSNSFQINSDFVDNKDINKLNNNFEDILKKESKEKIIAKILKNNHCADCDNCEACWISLNLCVILCLECSGIHRKMGPNVSKVRSLKLDNLNDEIIAIFNQCGTVSVNQIWEANIVNFMNLKPNPQSKLTFKEKWIKKKYVDKEFLNRKNESNNVSYLLNAVKNRNIMMLLDALACGNFKLDEKILVDQKNTTILHYACNYGNLLIIEILLHNGASLTITDDDNLKPVDLAVLLKKENIINYLTMKMNGDGLADNESNTQKNSGLLNK